MPWPGNYTQLLPEQAPDAGMSKQVPLNKLHLPLIKATQIFCVDS